MKILKLFSPFLLLSLFCFSSYGQKMSTSDYVNLASEAKEEYPEEKLFGTYQTTTYDFYFDKRENTCVALETTASGLLSLDKDLRVPVPKFYDTNSEIIESRLLDKRDYAPVKDEYYSSEGIFHSDSRVRYLGLYFPQFGQFKQTRFKKKYKDLRYLTTTYLMEPFPVKKITLEFNIPKWADVELVERNFEGFDVKKKEGVVEGKNQVIYTIEDAASMDREDGIPGISHVFPHVIILVKGYATNGKKETYFKNTDDLYNWYAGLVKKIGNQPDKLKAQVAKLTAGLSTDEEKMKAIYYWVQKNIRYIAFEDGIAGFQPEACQEVFEKRYGDCKGMANLTREMLKIAGIDARLTWLGTSSLDYDYSIPSLAVDNHMICSVVDGDKITYLDATEKYTEFGEYAQRIQGQAVLIEDGESYILKEIPQQKAENNSIWLTQNLSLEGEMLKGSATYVFSGESKSSILSASNSTKSEKWEEAVKRFLSKGSKNCIVSNVKHSDLDNLDEDVMLNYEVAIDHAVSSFGKELYVEMDYYKDFYYYEIDEPREYDYIFSEKKYRESTVTLEIPAGYSVQTLPEDLNIQNNEFSFVTKTTQKGNVIEYSKTIGVPNGRIPKDKIGEWNSAIKKLKEFYDTPAILTKD